jgi:hypothetical protein
MKSEKTFAEESRTIPDIIHSNVDRKSGEPADHPERTTFEPFESFEDPLGNAPEAEVEDWDSFAKVPEIPPNEGPIPGTRIQSIDGTKIQGTKDPLVDVLADEIGLDVPAALDSIEAVGTTAIADLTAKFGTDALGTYLPFHNFGLSQRTPWGIYLFLEQLLYWSVRLARKATDLRMQLSNTDAVALAFFSVFRHELFHFHVERFAVREEVIQRKPIYLPYNHNVFCRTTPGEDWLEECLAQACVIESSLVHLRVECRRSPMRQLLVHEFRTFGPGYRDFQCLKYGGPKSTHKLFGAQVVTGRASPGFSVTEFATPKRLYVESSTAVPGYLLYKQGFAARFQLGMPKAHTWKAFADANGISRVRPGPGDHEVWTYGKQRIQINRHRDELDLASVKAVSKILNSSVRETVEAIRQGRTIRPRDYSLKE